MTPNGWTKTVILVVAAISLCFAEQILARPLQVGARSTATVRITVSVRPSFEMHSKGPQGKAKALCVSSNLNHAAAQPQFILESFGETRGEYREVRPCLGDPTTPEDATDRRLLMVVPQ